VIRTRGSRSAPHSGTRLETSARRRGTAVAVLAVALVLGAALPARADAPDRHCIEFADDGTVVCAATLDEADAAFTAATGYTRVVEEAGRSLLAFSLATLYGNNGYGGSSYTITRSFACDGATVSGISDLSTVGMNNNISSFQTYGSCTVRLYDGTGYTGSTFGYASSSTSVGSMNDLASSVRVR
jgi:hypothetical protein